MDLILPFSYSSSNQKAAGDHILDDIYSAFSFSQTVHSHSSSFTRRAMAAISSEMTMGLAT